MIFPGFPGVLSFFQVFQVEWEPCLYSRMTGWVEGEADGVDGGFFLVLQDDKVDGRVLICTPG